MTCKERIEIGGHRHEWPLSGWTERAHRYWFRRCDMCKRRRAFQWLHECYPPRGSDFGWWFGCVDCVVHSDAFLAGVQREIDEIIAEGGQR